MADTQRPAEAANRADSEARQSRDAAEMTSTPAPHEAVMSALSVAAPTGGYGGAQGLS